MSATRTAARNASAQSPQVFEPKPFKPRRGLFFLLLVVNLISPKNTYNQLYLSNYATIQIRDELAQIKGVGDVTYLGQLDYSMRAWIDRLPPMLKFRTTFMFTRNSPVPRTPSTRKGKLRFWNAAG